MYSNGLTDAACNGTATWTNWNDIRMLKMSNEFYMSLTPRMNQFDDCSASIGMQMQFQSAIPNMNLDFGSNPFSYMHKLLNLQRTFMPDLKFQVRHCCKNIEPITTTTSSPIQNYTCVSSFVNRTYTSDITSSLVVYKQHYMNEANEDVPEVCGGIMLDTIHVLIHASCVNKTGRISNVIYTPNDESPINIDTIIIHPDYDSFSQKNNLAIVKLANEIEMPNPVCLPFPGFVRSNNQTSILTFELSGDGFASRPYEFMKDDVQILKDCPGIDQDHEFCILERGDLSGIHLPTVRSLIFDIQGAQKVLTGISYRRRIPVSNNFALVYSRVEPYVPWILSVIQKN